MSRSIRMTALALAAFCALAGPAVAQEPQDRVEGATVNVNEVLLDVLVTDSRGNVIVGLGPDDFVVTENGRPVDLSGVTFYSNRRLLESSPALAKQAVSVEQGTEDRYFILFFDDMRHAAQEAPRLLSQQMEAAKCAKGWVESELLPNDWVAVVSWDARLKVQQDFTNDRKALVQAIDDAIKGKAREGNYPSRIDASKGPSLMAGLPTGKALSKETSTLYEAMQVLAEAGGKVRGRKNLLLFSYGLPGRTDAFGSFVPDKKFFEPTVQTLNDNNVAAYMIDLTPAGTQHTLSDALNQMAEETGGRYFFNITNFSTPLDQVAQENNGYYLLSYSAEKPAGRTGFQRVEVKTANPEFRVRSRVGYTFGG